MVACMKVCLTSSESTSNSQLGQKKVQSLWIGAWRRLSPLLLQSIGMASYLSVMIRPDIGGHDFAGVVITTEVFAFPLIIF